MDRVLEGKQFAEQVDKIFQTCVKRFRTTPV